MHTATTMPQQPIAPIATPPSGDQIQELIDSIDGLTADLAEYNQLALARATPTSVVLPHRAKPPSDWFARAVAVCLVIGFSVWAYGRFDVPPGWPQLRPSMVVVDSPGDRQTTPSTEPDSAADFGGVR